MSVSGLSSNTSVVGRKKKSRGKLDMGPDIEVQEGDEIDDRIEKQAAAARKNRIDAVNEFEENLFVRERADEARQYANSLFKCEKYTEAHSAYCRLLDFCDDETSKVPLLANIAAVLLKQWRWKEALDMCEDVLKLEPAHPKAMYRKAQAHRGLRQPQAALAVIATAREVGSGSGELDTLEKHLKADIRRVEESQAEQRAKEERLRRRAREMAEKEAREQAASERGIELPAGSADEAGFARSWTDWFRRELLGKLQEEEARMVIMEEDGWLHVTSIPHDKMQVSADMKTDAAGGRALFYSLGMTLVCQCVQMRGTWDDRGAMSFPVEVRVEHVDNVTPPDAWVVDAKLPDGQGGYHAEEKRSRRVRVMFGQFVRGVVTVEPSTLPCSVPTETTYVAHVRSIVRDCVERLERETKKSLLPQPPAQKGAASGAEAEAARRKKEKEAKHAAKRKEVEEKVLAAKRAQLLEERMRAALTALDEEEPASTKSAAPDEDGPLLEANEQEEEDEPMLEENEGVAV